MLRYLKAHPETYEELEYKSGAIAGAAPAGATVNRVGAMFAWFFSAGPVTDWISPNARIRRRFAAFTPDAGARRVSAAFPIRGGVCFSGTYG